MKRCVRQLIAPMIVAALLLPAAAWASPDAVIRDCASDGSLDGSYSDADKRAALGQLNAELQEYSDCRSVIAASMGGGPRASSSSSSDGEDAAGGKSVREKKKAAAARAKAKEKERDRATAVALGGRSIDPGEPGTVSSEDTANGVSTPVVLALIALALMGAAGLMFLLSKRSPRVADIFRRVSFARFRR